MQQETALSLLCETFRRSRVRVTLLAGEQPASEFLHAVLPFSRLGEEGETVRSLLGDLAPATLYRAESEGVFKARYLLLPDGRILFVGPYLRAPLSEDALLSLAERSGISPTAQRSFREFCSALPVLSEGHALLVLLDSFCEQIFLKRSFAIVDVADRLTRPVPPMRQAPTGEPTEDVLLNMKAMEQRYAYENELIEAVSLGQLHKESLLSPLFSSGFFEKRVADPLRNAKNYHIIMNTLLRKAAERAGVHPLSLDEISSAFAREIEALPSPDKSAELMRKMFRAYCRLVRRKTIQQYSRIVQETLLLIDADLSAPLSLAALATAQGVSAPYLSTVFRRETGRTLSEYVREKRMAHAAHLLATTHLQVQTVALHCGILDLQYFSKTFKRTHGKTPKEYREHVKQAQKT